MRRIVAFIAVGLVLGACGGNDDAQDIPVPKGVELRRSDVPRAAAPKKDSAAAQELAAGNQAFAFDLYRKLSSADENTFLSPYSISTAIAMTYAGSKGTTESEIAATLHYTLPQSKLHQALNASARALEHRDDEIAPSLDGKSKSNAGTGFELSVVNQTWAQKDFPLRDTYLDVLGLNYGAGLFLVDFKTEAEPTRKVINGWVEEQTHERIRDLLPGGALDENTRLVLTNAIYFKASWFKKFQRDQTKSATFHAPSGDRSVKMMEQSKPKYGSGEDFEAVSLRYLATDVAMILILPKEGQFEAVRQKLDSEYFAEVRASLTREAATIKLPRWSFESAHDLKDPLSELGAPTMFDPSAADLSGIGGKPGQLFVDQIYHKAFIAVDEDGTEAAAATSVVASADFQPLIDITFDRPFMFVVFDEPTGQVLFAGQLVDPG